MHGMSIAEGILLTLEAEGKKHQFNKVKKVWLEVGRYTTRQRMLHDIRKQIKHY
jgi:Zn finger protein HypA/HybF involved in hydrogenase expression